MADALLLETGDRLQFETGSLPTLGLESGDTLLTEAGDQLLMENDPAAGSGVLLLEADDDLPNVDPAVGAVEGFEDTILVWDLLQKGWSTWPEMDAMALWTVRDPVTGVEEVFAGGRDGVVRVLDRRRHENAYPSIATHASALGVHGIEKSPRHVFMYFKEQGAYTLDVTTEFDFNPDTQTTRTLSLAAQGALLGSTFILGESLLGGDSQIAKRFNMRGVGEFLSLSVSNGNTGEPWTWIGYEVLWRYRRTVRRREG